MIWTFIKYKYFWKIAAVVAMFFIALIIMLASIISGLFGPTSVHSTTSEDGSTYMSGVMSPEAAEALKSEVTGDTLGDRMMSLSGKLTYQSTDGTNCMRTVSLALDESDSRYSYLGDGSVVNVETAVSLAKENSDYYSFTSFDDLQEGDILVYGDNDHVAVYSNGVLVQNGASHNTVYTSEVTYNGMPTGIIRGS